MKEYMVHDVQDYLCFAVIMVILGCEVTAVDGVVQGVLTWCKALNHSQCFYLTFERSRCSIGLLVYFGRRLQPG